MKIKLKKTARCLGLWASLAAFSATAQVTGPSTAIAPYIEPMTTNVTFTSLFTAGDTVNLKPDGVTPYRMAGLIDGLGAFDNHDGTFTVLLSHEINESSGTVRAHGTNGAFITRMVINKSTLAVQHCSDLITNTYLWNTNTSAFQLGTALIGRFCSSDLPSPYAFWNPFSGKGTTNRLFMNGEEFSTQSRAWAHVVSGPDTSKSWQLPYFGRASWENVVASPYPQDKTIVAGLDDDGVTDAQVYFWIGTKTNSGLDIVKAGLMNGSLYGVAVNGLTQEVAGTTPVQRTFVLTNLSVLTDIPNTTFDGLEQVGNTNGVTAFMRVEDGAWDPTHPEDFYFVTTGRASPFLPSRLWRLRFMDITQPELGGVIDMVLDGTEGQLMMDNLCVDANGNAFTTEDPGNNVRLSRIAKYYPATDAYVPLAQVKSNYFIIGQPNYYTQDEEISGIIDVSDILGAGKYLFDIQIHSSTPVSGDPELVEGGQLLLMQTIFPASVTGPSTAIAPYIEPMTTNVTFTSLFTAGDTVNLKPDGVTPYRMAGLIDGLGAFDNHDGTFTVLLSHEINESSGTVRAHGTNGAFITRMVINKSTLAVQHCSDLITNTYLWNTNTSAFQLGTALIGRFCSSDLPSPYAFWNPFSGKGTTNRLFMNGEEFSTQSRAWAHVVSGPDTSKSWQLPYFGRASWENVVASPYPQDKTIVAGLDDDGVTDAQVYFWIGTKTNSGLDIVKAGLMNGSLYGVAVNGLTQEVAGTTPVQRTFVLTNLSVLTDIPNTTFDGLEQVGNTNGVTAFMRVEDGAWDPTHPEDFYFVTTGRASPFLPSRLWRLRFMDITQPELGGVIDMVLDGTEGQLMMDNLCVDANGNAFTTEDPGNNVRLSRIAKYYPATDAYVPLAQVKSNYFIIGQPNYYTQDEEISGIIDVSDILGAGKYLFDIQIHSSTPVSGDPELVEGGQLLLMQTYSSVAKVITGQPVSTAVTPGSSGTFTVTVPAGSWVQWYFNGKPIAGANGATLTASNVGTYYAVVGNSSGSQVSGSVILSTTSIELYAGITVNGPVGSTYQIQYTTSLAGTPVWTNLALLTLTSSPMTYIDQTPANQAQRYYRAVAQ